MKIEKYYTVLRKGNSIMSPDFETERRTGSDYRLHAKVRIDRLLPYSYCPYYRCNSKATRWRFGRNNKFPEWSRAHFCHPSLKPINVNRIFFDGFSFSFWLCGWTSMIWGPESGEMYFADEMFRGLITFTGIYYKLSFKRPSANSIESQADIIRDALREGNRLWKDLQDIINMAQQLTSIRSTHRIDIIGSLSPRSIKSMKISSKR